ncbi:hypothetical protein FHS88_001407 [Roseomonas alkaliterrae]|uniref:Uncharacterized protein n=1 Tax=Neoroseomonas alkaliterrae TaxID=1452450 RepID=A0A840Y3T4_9PROT|nr:hypothetical protein [Neoroseomonas alkaliterrae]
MRHTDLPRSPVQAARTATREQPGLQEPPTGRALWPTFMRRTLEDENVRPARPPRPGERPLAAAR